MISEILSTWAKFLLRLSETLSVPRNLYWLKTSCFFMESSWKFFLPKLQPKWNTIFAIKLPKLVTISNWGQGGRLPWPKPVVLGLYNTRSWMRPFEISWAAAATSLWEGYLTGWSSSNGAWAGPRTPQGSTLLPLIRHKGIFTECSSLYSRGVFHRYTPCMLSFSTVCVQMYPHLL